MHVRSLSEFESVAGISFDDQRLLEEAFVHSSYANEAPAGVAPPADNERLEFLGDAVLEFIVSRYLFGRFPELREGELTRLRSALVRRDTLARIARTKHLGEFLILGKGEEESGGRRRAATLCATYEAVVGAIFLDQGLQAVEEFVMPDIVGELDSVKPSALGKDAKSRLQEWSQREFGVAPRYRVVESEGPDHAKTFVIEVSLHGHRCGVGRGTSKQDASQQAALCALVRLDLSDAVCSRAASELAERWPSGERLLEVLRREAGATQ